MNSLTVDELKSQQIMEAIQVSVSVIRNYVIRRKLAEYDIDCDVFAEAFFM